MKIATVFEFFLIYDLKRDVKIQIGNTPDMGYETCFLKPTDNIACEYIHAKFIIICIFFGLALVLFISCEINIRTAGIFVCISLTYELFLIALVLSIVIITVSGIVELISSIILCMCSPVTLFLTFRAQSNERYPFASNHPQHLHYYHHYHACSSTITLAVVFKEAVRILFERAEESIPVFIEHNTEQIHPEAQPRQEDTLQVVIQAPPEQAVMREDNQDSMENWKHNAFVIAHVVRFGVNWT
jgi:hypothetical protein